LYLESPYAAKKEIGKFKKEAIVEIIRLLRIWCPFWPQFRIVFLAASRVGLKKRCGGSIKFVSVGLKAKSMVIIIGRRNIAVINVSEKYKLIFVILNFLLLRTITIRVSLKR
jgi:hypothetical protein